MKNTMKKKFLTTKIKYLGIYLTKEVNDLYNETLRKWIINETQKRTDIPCTLIEIVNIIKMTKISKAIYMNSSISTKVQKILLMELEKIINN